jgi:hypothetical protein
MKSKLSTHISIAEQIVDGSIKIHSIQEFESILKIFPNDPALQRAYSYLLLEKNLTKAAVKSFEKTAQLYIDAGKILQAIDAKISKWKIHPPVSKEAQQFFYALREGNFYETPLNAFLHRLSYQEMVAIINKLVRVRLPRNIMVKKIGEEEKALYLIVSGTLRETIFRPIKKNNETLYRKETFQLSENGYFGDIYPFNNDQSSKSYIETITQTVLVKISKPKLIKICQDYSNVELGLIDLYKIRSETSGAIFLPKLRKVSRHQIPFKISLQIYTEATKNQPIVLDGYSRDLSIGGICVVLDGKYNSISSIYKNIKTAKIEMSLPKEEMALKVSGTIVWSREFTWKGKKIVALGFQFQEMSPKFRGMLFVLADSICNLKT